MKSFINVGILLMIVVAVFQSTMSAVVNEVSSDITTGVQVLAYYFIPLCIFFLMILKQGFEKYVVTRGQLKFFFLRGLFSAASVFCFFYAASNIPLGVAAILFNSTPVFIPLLATIFLKERSSAQVYIGIIISLLGVIIVIHPSMKELLSIGTLIGLASGFLMAISQVMLRFLARNKESVDKVVFYQYLMCVICAIIIIGAEIVFSDKQITALVKININDIYFVIFTLLILGVLSFFAQRVLTKAFQYMTAAKLAPFLYISVPVSSIIGWLVWHQQFTIVNGVGAVLVFFGIIVISFEERSKSMFDLIKVRFVEN